MSVNLRSESPENEYLRVYMSLEKEFPGFQVVFKKRVWWMHVISIFLKLITFGQMISFMSSYTTTIRYTVYVGSQWLGQTPYSRSTTLRHEAVHMRQLMRHGFFLYAFLYLFWAFPIGLAIGRRDLEREAYEETIRAYADYYGVAVLRENQIRSRITGQFTGSSYFWMWPFRRNVNRWYDEFVSELEETRNVDGQAR